MMQRKMLNVILTVCVLTSGAYGVYNGYAQHSTVGMMVAVLSSVLAIGLSVMLNMLLNKYGTRDTEMLRLMAGDCQVNLTGRLQVGTSKAMKGGIQLCRDGIIVQAKDASLYHRKDIAEIRTINNRSVFVRMSNGERFRIAVTGGIDVGTDSNVKRYAGMLAA